MCPSWEDCIVHFWSTFYSRPWLVWHPKDHGTGWGGLGLLITLQYLCNMCLRKALMEGSKSFLILPPVLLPKYKSGHCLLRNLQGFPSAYDTKGLMVGSQATLIFLTPAMPLQGPHAPATPSHFLWPEHLVYFLHWVEW